MSQYAASDLIGALVDAGQLDADSATQARRRMQRGGITPERALLDLNCISQEVIFRGVAKLNDIPFVELHHEKFQPEAVKRVPVKVVLHYRFMPLRIERGTLTAAFSSLPPVRDRENLRLLLGLRLDPVIATPADISRHTKKAYGLGADTVLQIRQDRNIASRFESEVEADGHDAANDDDADTASIRRLVNQILLEALEQSATDVHVEPFEDHVRLRYRIDGLLREIPTPPGLRQLHQSIISRMKIMADLDIAEKRLPHDGRIRYKAGDEEFDLRVSIMPTRYGETRNLRILNRQTIFFELEQLGLESGNLEILTKLLALPHGMILVTGPTGSGKSTTLYSALDKTDKEQRKVITVEDPIEYQLDGISQIQVREHIGLTFSRGLRSILRHDPDIVLVGEIRDGETAEIAIRAAMTGHLVLSTLHTNDAVGAVNRLSDMGIEPYLVGSTLRAVIAQRLVRRICPHCRTPDETMSDRIRREISDHLKSDDFTPMIGTGCLECNYTGYRGRLAIHEFFLMNEELEDMVAAHARSTDLRATARRAGMITMRQDGWHKVARGQTSIEEILRVTSSAEI
jgi:general secretion pathway protein E/type IV pilus assembly protein PilB